MVFGHQKRLKFTERKNQHDVKIKGYLGSSTMFVVCEYYDFRQVTELLHVCFLGYKIGLIMVPTSKAYYDGSIR